MYLLVLNVLLEEVPHFYYYYKSPISPHRITGCNHVHVVIKKLFKYLLVGLPARFTISKSLRYFRYIFAYSYSFPLSNVCDVNPFIYIIIKKIK